MPKRLAFQGRGPGRAMLAVALLLGTALSACQAPGNGRQAVGGPDAERTGHLGPSDPQKDSKGGM